MRSRNIIFDILERCMEDALGSDMRTVTSVPPVALHQHTPLVSMESLKNKVVLITGASSGIGAATAVEFAKYGATLALTSIDGENLSKIADKCRKQGLLDKKVLTVVGDVTVDADLTRIVNTAVSTFNTIHILINCAAGAFKEDILSTSVSALDKNYRLNLRPVVLLTKLVIPHLKKSKGSVVNISSISSTTPMTTSPSYGMMKAALDLFTKSMALGLARFGIRVNTINPGFARTAIHMGFGVKKDAVDEYLEMMGQRTPLGRVAAAEEVARSVVFLASDAASFTTGANLTVDGGFRLTSNISPRGFITGKL